MACGTDQFDARPRGASFVALLDRLREAHVSEVNHLHAEVARLNQRLQSIGPTDGLCALDMDELAERHGEQRQPLEDDVRGIEASELTAAIQVSPKVSPASDRSSPQSSKVSSRVPWESVKKKSPPAKEGRHFISWLVNRREFELFFCFAIFINALIMAAEVQYLGIDVGFRLSYPNSPNPAAETWPSAETTFSLLGWFFGVLFAIEIVLKVIGLRSEFVWEYWNWIDAAIVLLWCFSISGRLIPIRPQLLRLARLGRLLRMLRLVRRIQAFDSLYLITTAIRGSFAILIWTGGLLLVLQMMMALLLNQILYETYFTAYFDQSDQSPEELQNHQQVYEYFGTFTRAVFSMFELTLGNWPPIARVLSENVHEMFMLFTVVHKLTIGFAVVGVVNAVFMQETFRVAATDDVIMLRQKERAVRIHSQKMRLLFAHADASQDGMVSLEEFRQVLSDPDLKTWLGSMDLDSSDVDQLFELLDNGDGHLSVDELIKGVGKLKGAARGIDLTMLMSDHRKLMEQHADLHRKIGELEAWQLHL